jgi:hypothetical protein
MNPSLDLYRFSDLVLKFLQLSHCDLLTDDTVTNEKMPAAVVRDGRLNCNVWFS